MNIFGMVSTASSRHYTLHAVRSFFATTPGEQIGRFILIDNDHSLSKDDYREFPRCEVIQNSQPKSFAENANFTMSIAAESKSDLFFLNNDLIFTNQWLDPLLSPEVAILSPLSNRERSYIRNGLRCERVLDLNDYLGREGDLKAIVRFHQSRSDGLQNTFFVPFFCIKIPYAVFSVVGPLDESFGRGGAEDNDYCLRSYLAGYPVRYAARSYILHFSGKSTWAGAESPEESREREARYLSRFREKWGENLTRLSIGMDQGVIRENPLAVTAAEAGNFRELIEILRG